jgi:hypothetical protein
MSESLIGRRSFGRVRTVVHHSSIAWVKDFRPMEKDLLVRLRNPWEARPGELLDYQIEAAQSSKGRLQGVDVIYNREPSLAEIFELDTGEGLSDEGCRFLMRALISDSKVVNTLFSNQTSTPLKRQLIELEALPLPTKLVLKALQHQDFASSALARLLARDEWNQEYFEAALDATSSFEQDVRLFNDVLEKSPALLQGDFAFPEFQREGRVWMLVDNLNHWQLLRFLDEIEVPDLLALRFMEQGWFQSDASETEKATLKKLNSSARCALFTAALKDARRPELATDPFAGLEANADFQSALQALLDDDDLGAEARTRLGTGSIQDPAVAVRMLKEGLPNEMKRPAVERLITTQFEGDACALLGENAVLELADYSQTLDDREFALQLQEWLGRCPGMVKRLDDWLNEDQRRELALGCLCASVDFSRGLVQRLLPLPMPQDLRCALTAAISRSAPERWQDRYVMSDEEKAHWQDAGAPLL